MELLVLDNGFENYFTAETLEGEEVISNRRSVCAKRSQSPIPNPNQKSSKLKTKSRKKLKT